MSSLDHSNSSGSHTFAVDAKSIHTTDDEAEKYDFTENTSKSYIPRFSTPLKIGLFVTLVAAVTIGIFAIADKKEENSGLAISGLGFMQNLSAVPATRRETTRKTVNNGVQNASTLQQQKPNFLGTSTNTAPTFQETAEKSADERAKDAPFESCGGCCSKNSCRKGWAQAAVVAAIDTLLNLAFFGSCGVENDPIPPPRTDAERQVDRQIDFISTGFGAGGLFRDSGSSLKFREDTLNDGVCWAVPKALCCSIGSGGQTDNKYGGILCGVLGLKILMNTTAAGVFGCCEVGCKERCGDRGHKIAQYVTGGILALSDMLCVCERITLPLLPYCYLCVPKIRLFPEICGCGKVYTCCESFSPYGCTCCGSGGCDDCAYYPDCCIRCCEPCCCLGSMCHPCPVNQDYRTQYELYANFSPAVRAEFSMEELVRMTNAERNEFERMARESTVEQVRERFSHREVTD